MFVSALALYSTSSGSSRKSKSAALWFSPWMASTFAPAWSALKRAGNVDVLEDERLIVRVRGGGGRVPLRGSRGVPAGNGDSVKVSDEAVVILDAQGQGFERRGVADIKGDPEIGGAIHAKHLRLDIRADQWPVAGGPAAARHHRSLYRQSAIRHITHKPEIGGIPRAKTPLRRVEFNLGAPAAFVKDEIERVIARRREVESLQGVARAARVRVGHV